MSRSRLSFFNQTATPVAMSRLHALSYAAQGASSLAITFYLENSLRKPKQPTEASSPPNNSARMHKPS